MGCPRPLCPLVFSQDEYRKKKHPDQSTMAPSVAVQQQRASLQHTCHVSNLAMQGGNPKTNPNYRNNPSLLISFQQTQQPQPKKGQSQDDNNDELESINIIIDVGKTFREGALRWLPDHGVTHIDAVILTHEHMDAASGLDDVRGFQHWTTYLSTKPNEPPLSVSADAMFSSSKYNSNAAAAAPSNGSTEFAPPLKALSMPLYLSQDCLTELQDRFPWLLPKPPSFKSENVMETTQQQQQALDDNINNNKPVVERFVASFDVNVFQGLEPMYVQGLRIIPLPVRHGEDLTAHGFAFTLGRTNVVYLSDISRMLPATLAYIQTQLPPTDILIIDALHPNKKNAVHYSMQQALELSRSIQPRQQTYLIGINCDSYLPHDEMNEQLRQEYGGKVQLAHDGLVIETS